MKILKLSIAIAAIITVISCGSSSNDQAANKEGFTSIENEIKDKFGVDAYYTDLKIINIQPIGNVVSTTVTEAPESMKMGEWDLNQGTWKQNSEITLEVPEGSKASDFMFQLDEKISLSKLGELVEKSMKQLTAEKSIENPALSLAFIKFPKNGAIAETEYAIKLEPENGGTSFSFYYTLEGDLIKMDY